MICSTFIPAAAAASFPASCLRIDNNVNKAVFGIKGNEVLWQKAKPVTLVPSQIEEFQKRSLSLTNEAQNS